jgi:hypothetical protein
MEVGKLPSRPYSPASPINNLRDRTPPVGYKVSTIAFDSGSPVAASNSLTSLTDIMTNANLSACPNSCFRPVGLALDSKGRFFLSSDATGEIYVLAKTGASATGTATTTSANPTATKKSEGRRLRASTWGFVVLVIAAML